jgi:hypothetical protein
MLPTDTQIRAATPGSRIVGSFGGCTYGSHPIEPSAGGSLIGLRGLKEMLAKGVYWRPASQGARKGQRLLG